MNKRFCCPNCFNDNGLRDEIFPSLGGTIGKCCFCGNKNTILLRPIELLDHFEALVSIYEPDSEGMTLVEWLRKDWKLFSSDFEMPHSKELLGEILDDGEIVRKKFSPSPVYRSEGLTQWETLRDEMMHKNRWFLEESIDTDRLNELLTLLIVTDLPTNWYRARISPNHKTFPPHEMGAPPKELASQGRANPAGIPYLYLGSEPETATSEIRPHTGETACIAEFTIPEIKAVDLRDPRSTVSPFILNEASRIGNLREDLPLLERLGEELTRPVLPSRAAIDYIPTQYLCEFLKKCNYDGVLYRSSVSNGMNLALFYPDIARLKSISNYNVEKVSIKISTEQINTLPI